MNDNKKTYEILKKYWGYDEFRPMQLEIIESILSGRDTLALLPTGGGKSLTYQVPALISDGLCIVVTPLIALMKDQVDRLRKRAISAIAIHSGLSPRQIDIALDNCVYGDVKFLYVAPERLASEQFRLRAQRMKISLLAVDEAHCISQWGYDFRPSYLRISEFRKHLESSIPVLALTASATDMVVDDIMQNLKFKEPHVIRGSFKRKNLVYAVRHVEDKYEQLMRIINSVEGSGIIYVRTRNGAEELTQYLGDKGITAQFYHGGLPHVERSLRQDEWVEGKRRIMVATNAFGMGIDKADVRFVAHFTMSDSLEAYYQEAGRAGRDGKRSFAILLVGPDDNSRITRQFEMEFPPIDAIKSIYDKICSSLQIAIGEGGMSSHIFNIYEFCAREKLFTGKVQSALKLLQMNGYMTLTDELANPARLMFSVGRDDLYKVRVGNQSLDRILRVILRLYEGVFSEFRQINEVEIAHYCGCSIMEVRDMLKRMWQLRLIRYIPSNQSPLIYLDEDRLSISDLYISPETYKHRKELTHERFSNMLVYANNETKCRSQIIEEYFGGLNPSACGVCDICLERRKAAKLSGETDIEQLIIEALKGGYKDIKELVGAVSGEQSKIINAIDKLLDNGAIVQMDNGKLGVRS